MRACVRACVCVCVRVCVSVGGGGGDSVGGMELRVGSNMILFRYIWLLLIWLMYVFGVCVLHIVSCHNYNYVLCLYYALLVVIIIIMYYVCET